MTTTAPTRASTRQTPTLTLALTVEEAAASLSVSPDFFREHIAPDLRVVRVGRKKLVAIRELERWLDEHAARALGGAA